MVECEHI